MEEQKYDRCPICGHNFDEYDTFDTENSVDIFNYSKDGWVHWVKYIDVLIVISCFL